MGGGAEFLGYAVISPWIRELTGEVQKRSRLLKCKNCKNAYFDYRYTERELNKIYSEYRDENYLKIRSKWEPWFSEAYNSGHFSNYFVETRLSVMTDFLLEHLDQDSIIKIVDVGGDIGQFIPSFKNTTNKYVYETSNKKLVEGVERVEKLSSILNMDLVISAHVLEHLNSPIDEINNLLTYGANIYIEVPLGLPSPNWRRRNLVLNKIIIIFQITQEFTKE